MNNNYLGIEYSKDKVKCALLQVKNNSYVITELKIFESDSLNSSLNLFLDWKQKTFADLKIKAIVAVSESTIFLKELKLPVAKKTAIDEAVYWELSSASPLPPSQAIYEWTEVSRTKTEINVVAMAVREVEISNLIDKLELSNIDVVAIEPSSVSLTRVAGENYSLNTMLLMVGNKETDIVLLKQGKPVFSTTSDIALKRDKEKWKLSQTVSDSLAENTQELINFWEEKNNAKIQQVQITGDIVDKYFGLAASINKLAKIPVVIAKEKNIPGLKYAELPKAVVNRFFVAIGAVIRFGGDPYDGINLIPREKRLKITEEIGQKIKNNRLRRLVNYSFLGVLALVGVALLLNVLKYSYGRKIIATRQLVNEHPVQNILSEVRETNQELQKLSSIAAKHKDEGVYLKKLSEMTPTDINLTAIVFENKNERNWLIKGTGSREAVLTYYDLLVKGSGAGSVTMPYSNLNKDKVNEFEINLIW